MESRSVIGVASAYELPSDAGQRLSEGSTRPTWSGSRPRTCQGPAPARRTTAGDADGGFGSIGVVPFGLHRRVRPGRGPGPAAGRPKSARGESDGRDDEETADSLLEVLVDHLVGRRPAGPSGVAAAVERGAQSRPAAARHRAEPRARACTRPTIPPSTRCACPSASSTGRSSSRANCWWRTSSGADGHVGSGRRAADRQVDSAAYPDALAGADPLAARRPVLLPGLRRWRSRLRWRACRTSAPSPRAWTVTASCGRSRRSRSWWRCAKRASPSWAWSPCPPTGPLAAVVISTTRTATCSSS